MTRTRQAAAPARPLPDLSVETSLLDGPGLVVGMDEVGRGALAGPVSVGVVAVRIPDDGTHPAVQDSKALAPARRSALVGEIRAWAAGAAVGHASPQEIDRHGLSAALGLAGRRAWHAVLDQLSPLASGVPVMLLDGRDDWLTRTPDEVCQGLCPGPDRVHLQVKADARCASVAAASILAKVERDAIMVELDRGFPDYGWAGNKGYGAAGHRAALVERGVTEHHRRSWRLLPEPAVEQGELFGGLEGVQGAQWTA